MRHTIRTTPEGYPFCQAQYRDECLLVRFARAAARQLSAIPPVHHCPATLPAPAKPTI